MKVQQLIFDDEITLWWMRQSVKAYHIFLDGRLFTVSAVTHVTFPDLLPLHDYSIRITGEDGDVLWEEVVRTREQKPTLTVTDAPYRAKGDGIRNNTAALQRALDDCPSGGRVRVPRGIFLTGALRMHSDTELYLEEGAVLRGSARASDYLPKIPSRFEGIERECYQSLLNIGYLDRSAGTTVRNVAVRGRGVLEGGGRALFEDIVRAEKGEMRRTDEPLGAYARLMGNVPGWRVRGRLICICCAEQVIVSGIGIRTAPSWNIHMIYSRDVTTYGCRAGSKTATAGIPIRRSGVRCSGVISGSGMTVLPSNRERIRRETGSVFPVAASGSLTVAQSKDTGLQSEASCPAELMMCGSGTVTFPPVNTDSISRPRRSAAALSGT